MHRLFTLLACVWALAAKGFDITGWPPVKWLPGNIPIRLQLDATMDPRPLRDGKNSWNAVAQEALDLWNAHLSQLQLAATTDSGRGSDGNDRNEVFFSPRVYGRNFGHNVLAVTTSWRIGARRIEADTIFNSTIEWDSYRGEFIHPEIDLRRVAIHEFGHTLGLNHPDEAGQIESAIMNSRITDLDTLAEDDIRGAQFLYRQPGTRYTLNLNVDPPGTGAATTNPRRGPEATYAPGTRVRVIAQPKRRFRFTHWSGTKSSSSRVLRLRMKEHETLIANFTTNGAPKIPVPPKGQLALMGDSVTFNVRVISATPPAYQWRFNRVDLAGETGPTLSLSNVGHEHSGEYDVVVTNARGTTMSRPARLVVDGY